MSFRGDDQGAFQAFEAVLVAIMIASAILFVNATSNPALDTTGAAIDLTPEAQAAVATMVRDYRPQFQAAVNASLFGGAGEDEWKSLVDQTLDDDLRFAVQLHNGVGSLQLYPAAGEVLTSPRGAVQGTAYFRAWWVGDGSWGSPVQAGAPIAGIGSNPDDLKFAGQGVASCAAASNLGPEGRTWLSIWENETATLDQVPVGTPAGNWCYGMSPFIVTAHDADVNGHVDYPTVGLQLLLWDGSA